MKNYYYMIELSLTDMTEAELEVVINATLSAPYRKAPIFHGVHSDPKGAVHAAWFIDNKARTPNAKTSKLLLELAALMMRLERDHVFATLKINTRQV